MRQSIVVAVILAGTVTAGAARAQPAEGMPMSATMLCERNAQQVRDYIDSHQATIPGDQASAAMEDAKRYESQCATEAESASDRLGALRADLGMDPMTPQTAQSPDDDE